MTPDSAEPGRTPIPPTGLLRRNAAALVGGATSTLGVILAGSWLAGRSEGDLQAEILVALGVAMVWASIAAPLLAARGRTVIDRLLRGGVVIDAAGVALLVVAGGLVVRGRLGFTWIDALQAYCVLLTVGLTGLGLVSLGWSEGSRFALAMLSAVGAVAMLATPFWVEGMLQEALTANSHQLAAFATLWNPFYSLSATVGYSWSYADWMYGISGLGEDVPAPPVYWHSAVVRYALSAGVVWAAVGVAGLVRRRRRKGAAA